MQPVFRQRILVAVVLAGGLGISSGAQADDHVTGVITDHGNQSTVMVQTDGSSAPLTVVVDESTQVRRSGMLRSEKLSSDALKPGLRIKADGTYESPNIFVARRITFTKEDLRTSRAIEGGLVSIDRQVAANQQRLKEQEQQITANEQRIATDEQRVAATVGAFNARISNLDDYTVIHSMTVYFANGKAGIAPKYRTELQQFAAQVNGVKGAVVQVQGYASAVGSDAINQPLSRRRADAVTAVLQQSGVTPTDLAYPAAMGTTGQVASNKTAEGQAQNRRVVVKLLQNKGVAGQ
jgi:outer membrane protein OmpA-like peptidoglycan-associated protein